jgi:hypothetical protein
MKTNRFFLPVILWITSAIFTIGATADQIPQLQELASDILKASVPVRSYHANVSQTFEMATNSPSFQNGRAIPARSLTTGSYILHYSEKTGFHIEPGESLANTSKRNVAEKPSDVVAAPAHNDSHFSISIPDFLNKIKTWPEHSVTKEIMNGEMCYKISASNQDASANCWVSMKRKCILKVVLDIQGHPFSETNLNYRFDQENGWLLTDVDMLLPATGCRILLQYDGYSFSAE